MPKAADKVILSLTILFVLSLHLLFLIFLPFGQGSEKVSFVLRSGTSTRVLARQLKEARLLHSEGLFLLTAAFFGRRLIAGEYEFQKPVSLWEILRKMGRGERRLYSITIREGANIFDVADELERGKIMERGRFLELCRDATFLGALGIRATTLEGYLTPDTYFYSKEVDPERFIAWIVKRRLAFFSEPALKKRMGELGFDIHKTLTLASMIEREAKLKEEKPLISAVFHNRLSKGMRLDCDPTVIYGLGLFGRRLTRSHLRTPTPYNTYLVKGLPDGPICNPSVESIWAALYPGHVDYLYFVSRNDGTHAFSTTREQHERLVAIYQKNKR